MLTQDGQGQTLRCWQPRPGELDLRRHRLPLSPGCAGPRLHELLDQDLRDLQLCEVARLDARDGGGCLLGQLVHDWVGNSGKIKKYGCSYRGMDFPNEDITCKGVVTKKYEEGGEKLVDLEVWTENPQGKKTTPGYATVALNS